MYKQEKWGILRSRNFYIQRNMYVEELRWCNSIIYASTHTHTHSKVSENLYFFLLFKEQFFHSKIVNKATGTEYKEWISSWVQSEEKYLFHLASFRLGFHFQPVNVLEISPCFLLGFNSIDFSVFAWQRRITIRVFLPLENWFANFFSLGRIIGIEVSRRFTKFYVIKNSIINIELIDC